MRTAGDLKAKAHGDAVYRDHFRASHSYEMSLARQELYEEKKISERDAISKLQFVLQLCNLMGREYNSRHIIYE